MELTEDEKLQTSTASNTAIDFFGATDNRMPELTIADAERFIHLIEAMIEVLESSRTKGLLEIQESSHTLERVAQTLSRKLQQAQYQDQVVISNEQSLKAMDSVLQEDQQILDSLTQRASFLVQSLKSSLTEIFPNRDIYLTMV